MIDLLEGKHKSLVTTNTELRHTPRQRIYLADLDLALRSDKRRESD